jgi:proteic killer suppression protein
LIVGYRDRRTRDFAAQDLAVLPGNRFEALAGDRKGQYSIRINDQWRICFEWPASAAGPSKVEIVDYH